MRVVTKKEIKKRGCYYCLDYVKKKRGKVCIHHECPYHELDKYRKYKDYLKNEAPTIDLRKLL